MPISLVRHWLGLKSVASAQLYRVTCPCGGSVSGTRQARQQVLPCPVCGRSLFILPASPYPPVAELEPRQATRHPSRFAAWWMPASAAAITLIIAVAIFYLVLRDAVRPRTDQPSADAIQRQFLAGKKALALGKFLLAAQELEATQQLVAPHPEALPPADRRQLQQLQRQASLLADLSGESIDDILRHAADLSELDEQEWQTQFEQRYHRKSVIFDDEVRRQSGGGYQLLGYRFFVRGKPARLDLASVQLLKALPLDKPQRLLFGLRLHALRLEPGGTWVVHFEPDSGVLLTDHDAASHCCPIPANELREIIDRQNAWSAQLR